MELSKLKKEIPYKWRVQQFSKSSATAQCVAYIDARDVMDILDEAVGAENWTSDFKMVGEQMFAGIGIKAGGEWVWKWDTGAESNIEKEKGEASDSFKRAGVKWGIGRFLYALDIKTVKTNGAKTDAHKYPYVIDEQNRRVWNLTEHIQKHTPTKKEPTKVPETVTKAREAQREHIKTLLAEKGCTPKTLGEAQDAVKELTGLEFIPENYEQIIIKLTK